MAKGAGPVSVSNHTAAGMQRRLCGRCKVVTAHRAGKGTAGNHDWRCCTCKPTQRSMRLGLPPIYR